MICVSGNVKLPVGGEAQQKFTYKNFIGFGSNCQEYFINVDGFTLTSEEQAERSRRSEAALKCTRLSREVDQLYEDIKAQPEGERRTKLQGEHAELHSRKVAVCKDKRMEATALDQVELKITTSPRLPTVAYSQARLMDSSLKGLLFKYISGLPTIQHNAESSVLIKLDFQQRQNSVSMRVSSPLDSTLYRNIRIPSWARHLLPISTSRSMIEHSFKSITGSPQKPLQGRVQRKSHVTLRGVKPAQQKLMKHAILIQAGETCFSKGLVAECTHNAMASETRQQQVEFTCLDSRRRDTEDLVRKANEGTKINRLSNMKTSFVRPVLVPTECIVDY